MLAPGQAVIQANILCCFMSLQLSLCRAYKSSITMRNLHLIISAILMVPIAFAYGFAPGIILPALFDFKVVTIDLHNIFRGIMCLYLGMAMISVTGIFKHRYWETATIINIVFMSGLAIGRLASFVADGIPSITLLIGFFAEVCLAALSYFTWKKYRVR